MQSLEHLQGTKVKEKLKNIREGISGETKDTLKLAKAQKKSNKITPKHSKQKSNRNSKSSKHSQPNTLRSQYYIKTNCPPNSTQTPEYFTYGKEIKNKKKGRRNPVNQKKISETTADHEGEKNFKDYGKSNEPQKDIDTNDIDNTPIMKKIKIISNKGAINFNGDIVRRSRVNSKKNSASHQNSENMGFSSVEYRNGSKKKLKSKTKKKKNTELKDKKKSQSSKPKRKKEKLDSPPVLSKQQNQSILENNEDEGVKSSIINIEEIKNDIEQESLSAYEFILTPDGVKQRGQCLNIIGKICSSMNLKKQTFALALFYMDSFLDINVEVNQIKTISIAALMIALKIDHAWALGGYCSFASMQSLTTNKTLSISAEPKSQEKMKKKSVEKKKQEEKTYGKFNLNRPKLPNILTTVLSHEEIFSQYDRILCKDQIMDMEMQMMVKLNFKLTVTTYNHWVETLTALWDTYLMERDEKPPTLLMFRNCTNLKNLFYLSQMVETSYYFPYAYFYSKVLIVVSIMYILVRIRNQFSQEKEQKGFQLYKTGLQKSSNLIFVDKMGTNEIFGQFLSILGLQLGDMVNCCQYVSHYFNYKMLRVLNFEGTREDQFWEFISLYHYNPELFRFFQLKYTNQYKQ